MGHIIFICIHLHFRRPVWFLLESPTNESINEAPCNELRCFLIAALFPLIYVLHNGHSTVNPCLSIVSPVEKDDTDDTDDKPGDAFNIGADGDDSDDSDDSDDIVHSDNSDDVVVADIPDNTLQVSKQS